MKPSYTSYREMPHGKTVRNAATLITSLDRPPIHKMVARPVAKKGRHE